MNHFLLRLAMRKIAPAFEVVRPEIVGSIRENDLRMPLANESKSPPHCADIDCLPEPIQYEYLSIEHRENPLGARKICAEINNGQAPCQ